MRRRFPGLHIKYSDRLKHAVFLSAWSVSLGCRSKGINSFVSSAGGRLTSFRRRIVRSTSCALTRTITRTGHYLGYGMPRYHGNYPVRGRVPRFVRTVARNSFNTTTTRVCRHDSLPTVYNHVYPERGRYRNRYILNGGNGRIRVNGLRQFMTSVTLSNNFLPRSIDHGATNHITVVNYNPTNVTTTQRLTNLSCSIAVFRTTSRPNNAVACNVPAFQLRGRLLRHRTRTLATVNIAVRCGIGVNISGPLTRLRRTFSTIFVTVNAVGT